jgi:hypothetical protein
MTYTPNFHDPRVRARCRHAIGFVCGVMSKKKPRQWSTRYIDQYLGNQRNDLSKWLRNQLLICVDDFYKYNSGEQGICKKYLLNQSGLAALLEALETNNIQLYPSVVEVAESQHGLELTSGDFNYNDKSNRLWHPLQRYRRNYRTQILADHGYEHHYDIECCAPTLIYQYSQQIPEVIENGRWLQGPMDLHLEALSRYLTDRQQVRDELAVALELPTEAVKEIINALFAGAVISRRRDSDIYEILNGDLARIEFLKQHEYIQELVKDIRCCWQYIRPVMQKRTKKTPKGTERRLPVTARQKWHLYFELERRVINAVRVYLEERSVRYFLVHDGWYSDREIDRDELRKFVYERTGFKLNFDYEKTNNIQLYPSVVEVAKSTENKDHTNAND